jgi:hypothetical protein
MSGLLAVDVAAWRAHARVSAGGGRTIAVAMLLADLAEPLAAAHWSAIQFDLKSSAVRRLVNGAHVHPVGLRRILAQLVRDGLLARIRPLSDEEWGTYALAMPRASASTPAAPVDRPACRVAPAPGLHIARRRITVSPSVEANAERRQRRHPRRRRT